MCVGCFLRVSLGTLSTSTAPLVAQQLGLSQWTLDRHLAVEGTSFQSLLDEVRTHITHLKPDSLQTASSA